MSQGITARRRPAIFVEVDEATRWELRRAALDERVTARRLAARIVAEWLAERGYLGKHETADQAEESAER